MWCNFGGEVSGYLLFRGNFVLKSHAYRDPESCPLSGNKKHLLLGGYISITTMLNTIRNTILACCRMVASPHFLGMSAIGGLTVQ